MCVSVCGYIALEWIFYTYIPSTRNPTGMAQERNNFQAAFLCALWHCHTKSVNEKPKTITKHREHREAENFEQFVYAIQVVSTS